MSYSEITFKDKNPVKRWLQKQRLVSALEVVKQYKQAPSVICDFGAGNGELCKYLIEHFTNASIICYEPTPGLLNEAKENLKGISNVSFHQDISDLKNESIDLVFSLEVFEHLPQKEINDALQILYTLLKSKGKLVIGVPVEVGIPALYKGIFRMARRYGAFDAIIKNILISFAGNPPSNRPTSEITPGFNYHFEHVGFDFRNFREVLISYFEQPKITSSPFSIFGPWLMPEVIFMVEKS